MANHRTVPLIVRWAVAQGNVAGYCASCYPPQRRCADRDRDRGAGSRRSLATEVIPVPMINYSKPGGVSTSVERSSQDKILPAVGVGLHFAPHRQSWLLTVSVVSSSPAEACILLSRNQN